jgi:hypothetical protein
LSAAEKSSVELAMGKDRVKKVDADRLHRLPETC